MSGLRVLIADKLPPVAREVFDATPDIACTVATGLDPGALAEALAGVHGLIVRSATEVTPAILAAATDLRAVIRAGVGVDNIDVEAATRAGVVVMNVPAENTVSAAEHTIAVLLALARQVPAADRSMKDGRWDRGFQGRELLGKTLGLVGCGRVGREVATRLLAFGMRVCVYDPFLSDAAATALGVERVELDAIWQQADVVSLHAPLTDATRNLLCAERIAQLRDGAIVVNCARGGLVDEDALAAALATGRLGGAAIDVWSAEPLPPGSALATSAHVVATPHLGASTTESQDRVGRRAAEQMVAFLRTGAPLNAINAPAVPPELLPRLRPFLDLADRLGRLLGQHAAGAPTRLEIEYRGAVLELPAAPLTAALAGGYLGHVLGRPVPAVSAALVARERGCELREVRTQADSDFTALLIARLTTEQATHEVAGTLFGQRDPRLVRWDGYELDARPQGSMLFVSNDDRPNMLGHICGRLGEAGLNIAECSVGRDHPGQRALAVLNLDTPVPPAVCDAIAAGAGILAVRRAELP